jgi:hypothetical protein
MATTQTVLKTLAVAATTGAITNLAIHTANGHTNWASVTLTVLAVLGVSIALAADVRLGCRIIRRHLSRRPGPRFRCTHGDPAGWDDDEYEAYFAITADKTPRTNIQPAA